MTDPGVTPEISVVVCVSNRAIAEEYLLSSLRNSPDPRVETIVLDNVGNHAYGSIAEAYNAAAATARGRWLVFAHQDLRLCEARWADRLLNAARDVPFAIAGPSGIAGGRLHYLDEEVLKTDPELGFDRPLPAEMLDEALFVVPREQWARAPFPESLGLGFHLCAAEYSLRMRAEGRPVLLVPLRVAHYNLAAASPSLRAEAAKKRAHVLAWTRAAYRLRRAYPGVAIRTPQGRFTPSVFAAYLLFYGVFARAFPESSMRMLRAIARSGLYRVLNERVKGLSYQ